MLQADIDKIRPKLQETLHASKLIMKNHVKGVFVEAYWRQKCKNVWVSDEEVNRTSPNDMFDLFLDKFR